MAWWFKVSFFYSSSRKKSGSILEPFRHNISWRCRVRSDLLNLCFLRELLHGIRYPWKTFYVEGISMLSFTTYFLVIIFLFAWQVWLLTIGYCLIFLLLDAVYLKWYKTINRSSIIPRNWKQTSDVHIQHTSLRTDNKGTKTIGGWFCLYLLVLNDSCNQVTSIHSKFLSLRFCLKRGSILSSLWKALRCYWTFIRQHEWYAVTST